MSSDVQEETANQSSVGLTLVNRVAPVVDAVWNATEIAVSRAAPVEDVIWYSMEIAVSRVAAMEDVV